MKNRLTRQAVDAMEAELNQLLERRKQLIEAVREAGSEGDLSENAGLDTAKRLLALTEARINFLREQLATAEIVEWQGPVEGVDVGVVVTVEDLRDGTVQKILIADSTHFASHDGILLATPQSPVGRALIGRKVGDIVSFQNRHGQRRVRIIALGTPAQHVSES